MNSLGWCRQGACRSVALALFVASAAPVAAQVWETGNQLLTDGAGVTGAKLGSSLAAGDFDGDGRTDLAVGAPNQTVSGKANAGVVRLYLSAGASGLASSGITAMAGSQATMSYGAALAAGDFDDDGADELVVGVPGYDTAGPILDAGAFEIWGFSNDTWTKLLTISQSSSSVPGDPEENDHLGRSLAVGDFDGDSVDDLAVGAPDEDVGATNSAGAVNVFYGVENAGLTTTGSQLWYRSGGGIDGTATAQQVVGRALAAGNFDGDLYGDLAIASDDTFAGHLVILYGSGSGLSPTGQQALFPSGLPQDPSGGDFGFALAAADLDGDASCSAAGNCTSDLIVGMPNATVVAPNDVSFFDAGAAFVLYGDVALGGLDPASAVELTQYDIASPNGGGTGDRFGWAVAAGSLGGTAAPDLAFGAPEEDLPGASLAGSAHLLLSGSSPLETGFSQWFGETPGLFSAPAANLDNFGGALAIGDFDDDGFGDLAIGIPGRAVGAAGDAGAVQILYGALFADGLESQTASSWSNF